MPCIEHYPVGQGPAGVATLGSTPLSLFLPKKNNDDGGVVQFMAVAVVVEMVWVATMTVVVAVVAIVVMVVVETMEALVAMMVVILHVVKDMSKDPRTNTGIHTGC